MEHAGHQLLARAALTGDQDRRIVILHLFHHPDDPFHGGAREQEVLGPERLLDLAAEVLVLLPEGFALLAFPEGQQDLVAHERFGDVVVRPQLHRLDGGLHRAEGRHHDDGPRDLPRRHLPEQIEPAHLRHPDVAQYEVVPTLIERLERFPAVPGLRHDVPFPGSLVVKKGSKMFFRSSGRIPRPVSEMEIATPLVGIFPFPPRSGTTSTHGGSDARLRTNRAGGGTQGSARQGRTRIDPLVSMASTELINRFSSTCWSRPPARRALPASPYSTRTSISRNILRT